MSNKEEKRTGNCHGYCRYAKYCRYLKGGDGIDPEECGMYYKLEDLIWEAQDAAAELRRMREKEEMAGMEDEEDGTEE